MITAIATFNHIIKQANNSKERRQIAEDLT
jgi:uncharacterized protein YeeX (DUF496 family)